MLFYSDGLVEAHDPQGGMFGFPKLRALVAEHGEERSLGNLLLEELYSFVGEGWEQEDDITLLTLRHSVPELNFLELRKGEVRILVILRSSLSEIGTWHSQTGTGYAVPRTGQLGSDAAQRLSLASSSSRASLCGLRIA